ncbi:MAG: right-handed parallel beta-helix repeat-containing protein [Bacteroidales bacterium]
MKRLTLLCLFTGLIGGGKFSELRSEPIQLYNLQETINDTLWITDNKVIPEGETLHLAPGTLVLFDGPWYIEVRGAIMAEGTEYQPIIFKPSDTLGFSDTLEQRGSWHGLRFMGTASAGSVLRHCHFLFAKALDTDSLLQCGGVIHARGPVSVLFENCRFNNNRAWSRGGAVALFDGADLEFINCIFEDNATYNPQEGYGGAVYVWNAAPVFRNCIFRNNQAVWTGGATCMYYANPLINNCEFYKNFAYIGGGMAFYHCRPARTLCNNLVHGNQGLYFGGGISCNNASDPVFINNTLVDNLAMYGGGFYCNDSAAPVLFNTLIYYNTNLSGYGPVYIWDPLSHPDFYYCNIEGGNAAFAGSGGGAGYWGSFAHNIDIPPFFDSTVTWLYYPVDTSLVDRGTPASDTNGLHLPPYDFTGASRFVNGRVDIGVYERSGVKAEILAQKLSLSLSTDQITDQLMLRLADAPAASVEIRITDMHGKRVYYESQMHQGGEWRFAMNTRCLPSGFYMASIRVKGQMGAALFYVE